MSVAALLAALVLGGVVIFQLLLAAGLPLGRAAWGGSHRVLPVKLRVGSAASVLVLGGAAWAILARAGLVAPGPTGALVRGATWVYAALFALNTLGNLASRSPTERWIMAPVTVVLAGCFVWVAAGD